MDQNKISPVITLKEIFGPNLVLNPRPSFSNFGWLPEDRESLTGPALTIAGDMPVICSSSVASTEIAALLETAGIEIAPHQYIYHTEKEHRELLNLLGGQGYKFVFNHLYPSEEIKPELYWIDPLLIAFLNNKSNLEKLVPSSHLPRRVIIRPEEISKTAGKLIKLPLVIKAATDQPTGGGYDIVICTRTKEVDWAGEYFRSCKTVVLEEYIEVKRNYCVQLAKPVENQIIYLGASEQITTPSGHYLGNWILKNQPPPEAVKELGRSIMEYACNLGFFGICGFDIVLSKDNRLLVIDLNFRLNGSTPALLLRDSIMRNHNASVMLFRKWMTTMKWHKLLFMCSEIIKTLNFIPITVYSSASDPDPNSASQISGILFGSSREEVLIKEHFLRNQGLI